MGNFEQILARIKDITGKNKNKDIAELLNTNESTFGKWVSRNKIPYEQILKLCIENNYDIKYIFTGTRQNGINNKNIINGNNSNNIQGNNNTIAPSVNNSNKQLLENINKLNKKRQEYYFYKIGLEVIEQEEEK